MSQCSISLCRYPYTHLFFTGDQLAQYSNPDCPDMRIVGIQKLFDELLALLRGYPAAKNEVLAQIYDSASGCRCLRTEGRPVCYLVEVRSQDLFR